MGGYPKGAYDFKVVSPILELAEEFSDPEFFFFFFFVVVVLMLLFLLLL